MLRTRSLLVAALVGVATRDALAEDRCTAILVGAKASTTNAPMTTHTNDCSSCDFRIVKVPARKHAPGAVHEVVLAGFDYPRYAVHLNPWDETRKNATHVCSEPILTGLLALSCGQTVGSARGSEYLPENLDKRFYNWTATPAIGTIPQVNETFAYIDGAYGIINEHQVAIGESTCGARFVSKPLTQGGDALFDVSELSRIALQRAKTAREAIQIMGDLGVKYGYYGAEWEGEGIYAEAGEALTVTDTAEAWMFHILPDDTGKSAIWAAQRVPDDHISAVANQFVIHEIDVNKTDEFMASTNIYEVALRNAIWNQSEPFDFTKVYSHARDEGHQYYSTRRVWRLFTLADPTLDLSPETDVFSSNYPFSVKTAQKLSPHDIMRFQRDHYEGTAFDMTEGPSGGPYGDPDRYDGGVNGNMTEKDVTSGTFERAISIFRASYSFVSILDPANADNAYIWFGQYAPHATSYAPVYTKVDTIPMQYTKGSLLAFDRESSFWVHALVGNWVARFYKFAHPFVSKVQLDLEALVGSLQSDLLQQAALVKKTGGEAAMVDFLTEQSALFASQSHKTFTELFEYIVTVFHDGYQMSGFYSGHLTATPLFYPKWWLQQVGYYGDAKNTTATKEEADDDKDTIMFPPAVAVVPTVVPTVAPATVLPSATKEPTVVPTPVVTSTAPTAAPTPATTTAAPATELPLPLPTAKTTESPATATPSPTSTPEAVEVQVRSSGDGKSPAGASTGAHQVSYWVAALIALLSMVVGVFIGRNFNGFKKTGYRPIR